LKGGENIIKRNKILASIFQFEEENYLKEPEIYQLFVNERAEIYKQNELNKEKSYIYFVGKDEFKLLYCENRETLFGIQKEFSSSNLIFQEFLFTIFKP
jgi:hypothetical protein